LDYTPARLWLSDRFNHKQKESFHKNQQPAQKQDPQHSKLEKADDINIWDQISLETIKKEHHDNLFTGKSQFQDIEVIAARDIRMYLNGQLQFSSLDERIYHEAFVHIPIILTENHQRVLILGGGDALALREVLKYQDVQQVDLVDIDSEVLTIAKNVPELVALNQRALYDKRVRVHAMDALTYLQDCRDSYDLIIVDFPDPAEAILANLYTVEVFEKLKHLLDDHGIIVCQSNSPMDTPLVYWSIGLTIEKAGFYTMSYHTIVPSFDDWGFHLACKKPIKGDFKKVTVPHKTLPKDLATLFVFAEETLSHRHKASVNSSKNLCLHHIYRKEIT
jgi:spermidine synthase